MTHLALKSIIQNEFFLIAFLLLRKMLISQNDSKMKNSKMLLNDRFRSNDLFFFDLRQSLIRSRENVF